MRSVLPLHFFHLITSVGKWTRDPNTQFTEKEIQITHKRMKGCSTSFIIRKMQIKSTQSDHFSPIRLAKIQKADNTLGWQDFRTRSTLVPGGEVKTGAVLWRAIGPNLPRWQMCMSSADASFRSYCSSTKWYIPEVTFGTEVFIRGAQCTQGPYWSCSPLGPQLSEQSLENRDHRPNTHSTSTLSLLSPASLAIMLELCGSFPSNGMCRSDVSQSQPSL